MRRTNVVSPMNTGALIIPTHEPCTLSSEVHAKTTFGLLTPYNHSSQLPKESLF